jgi:hypothetical protein
MAAASQTTGDRRHVWEPPTLTVLSLRAGTAGRLRPADAEPIPCPQPPRPAEFKPGMYIELMTVARFSPAG